MYLSCSSAFAISLQKPNLSQILTKISFSVISSIEYLSTPTNLLLYSARSKPLLEALLNKPNINSSVDSICKYWIRISEDYDIIHFNTKRKLRKTVLSLENLPELENLINITLTNLIFLQMQFKASDNPNQRLAYLKKIARRIELLKGISDCRSITHTYIDELMETYKPLK
jgi:hypothetical protein